MRLRTRLVLALGGTAAGSLLIAAFVAVLVIQTLAFNIFVFHQMKQTEILGGLAGAALESRNEAFLRQYLRAMTTLPGVQYAYVADKDGRIVLHTHAEYVGQPVEKWHASEPAAGAIELKSPARLGAAGGDGAARVGYALGLHQILASQALTAMLPPVVLFGSLVVVLSLGLAVGLAFYLSRPISELAEASRKVGAGDLEIRVEDARSGEIGELMRQFNAMVRQLKALDEMKDEFIASVSHDLRNPMAAIKMNLEYMLNEGPDRDKILPAHRIVLARAMDAATRLGVFVTNILDSAKMKAGRMEYRLQPVSVAEIARDMEALYGVTARQRKIALRLELPADLPAAAADPERLEHVLSNLVSNALKFTRAGGAITIGARPSDGMVEIFVADTGQGIPREALSRLFQRFAQAGPASQRAPGSPGTGLGLFIVKQAVEGMGGSVAIDSEPGRGTRVAVRLRPAAGAAAAPQPPAQPAHRLSAKIMIVDDDDSFSEVTRLLLESKGYRTVVANEGKQAAQAALSARPDLILMDMDLRELTGADVIRQLKAEPTTARIPVILCSAAREAPEIARALELGAECFLPKPLKSSELYLRIQQILSAYHA